MTWLWIGLGCWPVLALVFGLLVGQLMTGPRRQR